MRSRSKPETRDENPMQESASSDVKLDPVLFRRKLMSWYKSHARELPWRGVSDPYRTWLSEVMLQQTRVAAVIDHYDSFLRRFPTMLSLALAPESEVLAIWSGLGYYRRARLQPGKRPGLDSLRRRFLGIFDKSAIDPALREWLRQRIAHTVRSDLRRERRDQDKPLASGSVKNKDPHICHTTEIHFAAPIYPPPSVSSVTAAKNLMRASGGVNRCWSGLPLHRRPS